MSKEINVNQESINEEQKDPIEVLKTLREEAEALVREYNEAFQNADFEKSGRLDALIAEKCNSYTGTIRNMFFKECKESPDPMLAAVSALTFVTIAAKDDKKNDEKIPVRKIVEKEVTADLEKLHDYCGGIGKDPNWMHYIQKLNFLLTAQKCVDLGVDPKEVNDSYAMSEIAKELDMGKTPTSKTNMLRTLQKIIDAMLGEEYKAKSHDVNYLLSIYSKKGRKALSVTCANHKNFRNYIAEICHRIVAEKDYDVQYKAKK